MTKIKYGAYDMPDQRDYLASDILGTPSIDNLPDEIDLRMPFFEPKNQYATVECTCFGIEGAHEVMNEKEHEKPLNFDPHILWNIMKELGQTSSRGASLQSALKALLNNGSTDADTGKVYKIGGYARIENTFDAWYYWLSRGFTIYTGAHMDSRATRKNGGNFVFGTPDQGHSIYMLGGKKKERTIKGMNSFGKWGSNKDGSFTVREHQIPEFFSAYVLHDIQEVEYIYKDVNENNWAFDLVKEAKKKGIVEGYEDDTFRPNQPITRAEMLSILKKLNLF